MIDTTIKAIIKKNESTPRATAVYTVSVCVCVFERERKGGEIGFVRLPSDSLIRAPQERGFKHVNPNKASP